MTLVHIVELLLLKIDINPFGTTHYFQSLHLLIKSYRIIPCTLIPREDYPVVVSSPVFVEARERGELDHINQAQDQEKPLNRVAHHYHVRVGEVLEDLVLFLRIVFFLDLFLRLRQKRTKE